MTEPTSTDAVRIERVVAAPIAVVWQMWTDPIHFAAWYGPGGATVIVEAIDLRVGGRRHVEMRVATPGGERRMWFTGEHLEIAAPHRLVYTESMADEHGTILSPAALGMPEDHPTTTTVTVALEDLGGRTRMTMTHAGIPQDSPGAIGWNMAFDKLAAHLAG
jgi:uncharacterized protein YndB with AHSA1/START domain